MLPWRTPAYDPNPDNLLVAGHAPTGCHAPTRARHCMQAGRSRGAGCLPSWSFGRLLRLSMLTARMTT